VSGLLHSSPRGERNHGPCWLVGLGRWCGTLSPAALHSTEMLLNPDLKVIRDLTSAG